MPFTLSNKGATMIHYFQSSVKFQSQLQVHLMIIMYRKVAPIASRIFSEILRDADVLNQSKSVMEYKTVGHPLEVPSQI
jgi:hypothetical protein